MKIKIKIMLFGLILVVVFLMLKDVFVQGMLVYDNINFISLVKQLLEFGKQMVEMIKFVKFLKDVKEVIEKVLSVV